MAKLTLIALATLAFAASTVTASAYSGILMDGNNRPGRDLLNTCLVGRKHKTAPGPEDVLHQHCSPWKSRSCCTTNTTHDIHNSASYNFNYNHCPNHHMSDRCRDHFIKDLCFYECSPNVGPWLVKDERKIRRERFVDVPLCAIDCERWFEDCKDDFTCTNNWARNFVWEDRDGDGKKENNCPANAPCKKFQDIWGNAKNFCESIWDNSWKYTPNPQACMRMWFDENGPNPNDAVAKWKADQLTGAASTTNVVGLLTLVLSGFGLLVV